MNLGPEFPLDLGVFGTQITGPRKGAGGCLMLVHDVSRFLVRIPSSCGLCGLTPAAKNVSIWSPTSASVKSPV